MENDISPEALLSTLKQRDARAPHTTQERGELFTLCALLLFTLAFCALVIVNNSNL